MTARIDAFRVGIALAIASLAGTAHVADTHAVEAAAHDAYVAAINSNDIEAFVGDLTEDVAFQSPNAPQIIVKAAVRAWGADHYAGYHTHWEKTSIGFTVAGDWAFKRYS
jgi:ketosteroid isomerase-like protein